MTGYIILMLVFLALVALCFVPGLTEYFKPKDAGPLRIDMNRNIDERHFSQSFKAMIDRALRNPKFPSEKVPADDPIFGGADARITRATINRGKENIVTVNGSLSLPQGAETHDVLVVRGNLKTGPDCSFKKEIFVEGNADIGPRNNILCLSAANINVDENSEAAGWLDAVGIIHLMRGVRVHSRATAGEKLIIEDDVAAPRFAAPDVVLGSRMPEPEYDDPAPTVLSDEIEWTPTMDSYLSQRFETDSLEEIRRAITIKYEMTIPEILILRRASLLGLIDKSLFKISGDMKPPYMRSNAVWLQGGETARVKGSIEIPDGEIVPFNLIVQGNLKSGERVIFQGGVHVKGAATIGRTNRLWKSLVCARDITLGEYTIVENCVDAEGDITVKNGVKVGIGLDGGGMSAGGKITLAKGFSGKNKAFAAEVVATEKSANEPVA